MADDSAQISGNSDDPSGLSPRERLQKFQLTDEEIQVLKECRTNSFYFRGIPAGVLSLIATRYLAHNYFPHLKRWSGLYYTSALTLGMIAGVTSYRHKCFSKIMSLDNSRLADEVRKFQKRATGQSYEKIDSELDTDSHFSSQEQQSQYRTPLYQPRQGRDQRSFGGSYRINDAQDDEGDESKPTSYEELRKRHRESRMQGPKRLRKVPQQEAENTVDSDIYDPDITYDRRETYSPGSSWEGSIPQASHEEEGKSRMQQWPQAQQDRPRRNKYGDEME